MRALYIRLKCVAIRTQLRTVGAIGWHLPIDETRACVLHCQSKGNEQEWRSNLRARAGDPRPDGGNKGHVKLPVLVLIEATVRGRV